MVDKTLSDFIRASNDIQVGGTHYTEMGVQPWEVMEILLTREEYIGFLKGCLIKYSMRQGKKDSDDANKFRHYRQKLKEVTGMSKVPGSNPAKSHPF